MTRTARQRIFKIAGAMLLALAVFGIAAPFVHADRYRGSIQTALSSALGRTVTVGEVRLDLFTGPGFSVRDVVISDDAASSAEPFAYVGELRAIPQIWSFWTGRLEFSSIVLLDCHLNLARFDRKDGSSQWNFEPLLRPGLLAAFPVIRIRDGRINFKVNGLKSNFYLLGTDLDVAPRSADGREWEVNFSGEPARTDRTAHGFGALEARARWKAIPASAGSLELDLKLVRSELGDVVALVNGRDVGVHGLVSGQVHVAGAFSALGLEGEVRFSELHGWDQSPPPGGVFPFRISGTANSGAQHFELFAEPKNGAGIAAHVVGEGILQKAEWTMEMRSDALPVSSLPSLLRNFGTPIPGGLGISGTLQGELRYSGAAGWEGDAVVRDAGLLLRGSPPLRCDEAAVRLAGGSLTAGPARVVAASNTIGTAAATYSFPDGSFQANFTSGQANFTSGGAPLTPLLAAFPTSTVPLLSMLHEAKWSGELHYAQRATGAGRWTGTGTLTDAAMDLPLLAQPLRIAASRFHIDGAELQMERMTLQAGDLVVNGDYRYLPDAVRPHQFHLFVEEANLSQVETLLQPALRRDENLIDLALTLGRSSIPAWLRTLHAEGTIQMDLLHAGAIDLVRNRSRVQWDGAQILLSDWQSHVEKASLGGRIAIDLREPQPQYAATTKLSGFEWQGGSVFGTLRLQTSGSGVETLANLHVNGAFEGRNLEVEPLGLIEKVTGEAQMSWNGDAPQFRFEQVRMVSGGETWIGSGVSQGSGNEVVLQLSSKGKQMSLAGSLTGPAANWVER